MVAPSGYSAYPDAVTNANVIIGQVNDHTTAEIKNLGNELNDNINNSTESVLEKLTRQQILSRIKLKQLRTILKNHRQTAQKL